MKSLWHLTVAVLAFNVVSLLLLVVLSCVLGLYLLRQSANLRIDMATFRPQAEQVIAESEKRDQALREMMARLAEYAKSHPDFAPVLAKYRSAQAEESDGSKSPP